VHRTTTALIAAAMIGMLMAACAGDPVPMRTHPASTPGAEDGPTDPGVPEGAGGDADIVTSGLRAPWSIVFVDDTPLVSERDSARILEIDANGTAREVGIVAGVRNGGEAGLLGMAVDDQDRLFVYSTAADGNRIQRYDLNGGPGSYSLGEPVTVIDGLPSASYHDGGRIAFGPDGMLYATVGDAGTRGGAQDLDSLAGKILRLTPDGDVPDDNPFAGSPVYSYGHRNPQGLTWDEDGTMYATEFGQDTWDELNVISAGGNFGWPEVEGIAGSEPYIDPVQQWGPDTASPSGMTYLAGTLYIANLRGEVLRAVLLSDLSTSSELHPAVYGRLRDVAVAPDGRLWFATSNTDGRGQPGPQDDRIVAIQPAW
jgi:glucose/arabinose dehydrogenase